MSSDASQVFPINDANVIDIVGERVDGGLDLIMVASGDLDDSPETLGLLATKLRQYVVAASTTTLRREYGIAAEAQITIIIKTEHLVSREAHALIDKLRADANTAGTVIVVRARENSQHRIPRG
jgi:hypothetical protein